MKIESAQIIELPKILDKRGNLSIIEEFKNIPFKIERTYWIYDVPGGESRGGHAYRENEEFIVALSGSFAVFTVCIPTDKTVYEEKDYIRDYNEFLKMKRK